MRAIVSGEGVTLTRIASKVTLGLPASALSDLSLCRLETTVLLGQMHQQRGVEAVDLAQILLGVSAVIGDGCVDAIARGRQERHQPAEAKTEDGDLAGATTGSLAATLAVSLTSLAPTSSA